jgi:HAD superfamily hydrolase (TIGR01490 family)
VFDLDGTITRHDTLLPYLLGFLRRHPARSPALVTVLPVLARFAARRADHGALKSAVIRAALGGASRTQIEAWTSAFVPRLLARGLWPDARAQIERHRAAGDALVLMSASVDLYAPAIGRALGFSEVVCTELRWNGERLAGTLASANRRGAEKARCLGQLRSRHPGLAVVAYGNAVSDLGHLCLADRGVLVNGSTAARRAAQFLGVAPVTWR